MAQWNQDSILKLIAAYRNRRFLWDHTSPDYTNRSKRVNAWKDIANELGCDVMTVERKLKSLKTQFTTVHKEYIKRRFKAGFTSANDIRPKWFAYESLAFLVRSRAPRMTREILNGDRQQGIAPAVWKPEETSAQRDEFTVFAEHVAIRLKNISDPRARLVAQHQINNILFEAEMGKYNVPNYEGMMECMDEPSTSNDDKMIMNFT